MGKACTWRRRLHIDTVFGVPGIEAGTVCTSTQFFLYEASPSPMSHDELPQAIRA